MFKNILVITDNLYLYKSFKSIIKRRDLKAKFCFRYSDNNEIFKSQFSKNSSFISINVANLIEQIIKNFDLVISLHCKQSFPPALARGVKCINIHPGYNPFNRGWYPHTFSILNNLPAGATIHEIDEQIDHGRIIDQKQVQINSWDTSLSVYEKILTVERELIEKNIENIILNNYRTTRPKTEGNFNFKKDYEKSKEIKLNQRGSFGELVDRLRALTHGTYKNAYFIDKNGKKIYLKIVLELEEKDDK